MSDDEREVLEWLLVQSHLGDWRLMAGKARTIIERQEAELARLRAELSAVLSERNRLAAEVGYSQSALGPLANIADDFLGAKGSVWCKHWEGLPISQLGNQGLRFKMPTLQDCFRAKSAAEGETERAAEALGEGTNESA